MENDFDYKSNGELKKLPLEELKLYERQLRKYEYENDVPITDIEDKNKINNFIRFASVAEMLLLGKRIRVVGNESIKSDKPKIFVSTHVGRYDFEADFATSPEGNYLMMGDAEETYRNFEGKLLDAKGRICMDLDHRDDCHICEEKAIKILNNGGNLAIKAEGAWNLSANKMVLLLFDGAVRMAKKTGAEIIPKAVENYGKLYCVNIGKNYTIPSDTTKSYRELSNDLRDELATLKWAIYEQFGIQSRADFSVDYDGNLKIYLLKLKRQLCEKLGVDSNLDLHKTYEELYEKYVNDIMKESENGYTLDVIEREIYNEKGITSPEEAFAFRKSLKFNGNSHIENERVAMVI